MSKAVLISIQPKWCELIVRGKKTVEVRKTRPKLETPFKCYIYQTKGKERLLDILKDGDDLYGEIYHGKPVFIKHKEQSWYKCLNGNEQKIIGEFVCDKISEIRVFENGNVQDFFFDNLSNTCLTYDEISEYIGRDGIGYNWHISELAIYDKPRELGELRAICRHYEDGLCGHCEYYYYANNESYRCEECAVDGFKPLKKPPQSWCYVEQEGRQ